MSLSDDQVRRLARLARIAIRPEESEAVLERLNRVLGLIDEMRAVDTRGIEPMAHPLDAQLPEGQRLRPDAVTEPVGERGRELYQSVAPAGPDGKAQVQDGLYLVPKVIE
jgi:aspartyl-tRNA(Asn)/glutamyl-tRNA(Gln) amidotransferase subunit C